VFLDGFYVQLLLWSNCQTGKDYAIGARVSSSYLVSKNNKKKKSSHLKLGGGGRESSSSSTVAVAKLYSMANSFSFQPPSPIPEVQNKNNNPLPRKNPPGNPPWELQNLDF
jgi:hypothetical protein